MKRISGYEFVKATPDELSGRVATLIEQGFQPFGAPVMISKTMIGQTLIRFHQTHSPTIRWVTASDPKTEKYRTFSEDFRAALAEFTYALANGTLAEEVLPESIDYSCIFREPGVLRQTFAVWANVMDFDREGSPTNVLEAQRRAAEFVRSYIDPAYEATPFEDWEMDLNVGSFTDGKSSKDES